jgi:hypothetical protein
VIRTSVCAAVFSCLPCVAAAQPDAAEREAIIAVVQRFFDSMATRDVAQAAAVLVSDGRLFSVREEKGETVVRSTTIKEYLERMPAGKQRLLERMWNPEVKLHRGIAVLWAPYDFYRDGKFSHCGVDSFDLVKTQAGWQIAGAMFTVERTNCPPSPLGAPK